MHAAVQVQAQLPDNDVQSRLSDAIGLAVREAGHDGAVVLMVVQPGETNAYDQQVCTQGSSCAPGPCTRQCQERYRGSLKQLWKCATGW